MKKSNDWKDRLNVVFSTNPDFKYDDASAEEAEPATLPNEKQKLRIELDKRSKGKVATLVTGFVGTDADLAALARTLKNKCGAGGSSRCGEILIQGDVRQKVNEILTKEGYKTRVI
jgi:translation initiation factor 1